MPASSSRRRPDLRPDGRPASADRHGRLLRRSLLGVAAVLAAGTAAVWWARTTYDRPGPLTTDRLVVVPRGSPAQVADALAAAGVVADRRSFLAAAELTRGEGTLHAGEFAFPAGGSLDAVLAVLHDGKPVQHRVTIPEGLTAAEIATLLARTDALAGEPILPAEGAVLPDTYAVERGASPGSVVARAEAAMRHALADIWAGRDRSLPLAEPAQLVVLASLVERETARPEERARVAAVFANRLRQGMRLQSDPTVGYAVAGGLADAGHRLTHADLAWTSPYNTYAVAGLPPTPIASPGLAALQAAAHPAAGDELYFVADGSGGHAFARTLDEHVRNVARWRQLHADAAAAP